MGSSLTSAILFVGYIVGAVVNYLIPNAGYDPKTAVLGQLIAVLLTLLISYGYVRARLHL